MPAIDSLMKRLGFVKLAHYGLVLTPEGRILSMRPAVLDDGLGGRLVGWQDGDLAAMELEKWEPARPAPTAAAATRVAATPPKRPPVPARPVPVVASIVPAPAIVRAPMVAAAPVVEEDDWEWTIAMARARAAAEESELAAAAAAQPLRRARAETVPPPVARAKLIAAKTLPMALVSGDQTQTKVTKVDPDGFPKTEPLGEIDYNDYTNPMTDVVRVIRRAQAPRVVLAAKATPPAAAPVVRPFARPSSAPVTVIPIPRLPSMKNTGATRIEPVVRAAMPTPLPPAAPRRFARGTGPQPTETVSSAVPSEDTVPSFVLPPVPLPSIKRLTRG
jgi:hypothetical protein